MVLGAHPREMQGHEHAAPTDGAVVAAGQAAVAAASGRGRRESSEAMAQQPT